MNVLISGYMGHMGQILASLALNGVRGATLAGGVDVAANPGDGICAPDFDSVVGDFDVVIDFSHHTVTKALTDFAVANNLPLVIATTGQTDDERAMIAAAARKIPVFFAANYSLGVALLIELAKKTAAVMTDAEIEIIETHHNRKVDAPSGTAMAIANAIREVRPESHVNAGRAGYAKRDADEIGIQSVRIGNVVGIHEVLIGTPSQTITLKHEAHDRALFAEGALAAAEFIIGKPAGLYDMKSIVKI